MTQTTTQPEAYVELYAQKARLLRKGTQELFSSGMTGVTRVAFAFSEDWEGLRKTAVFTNGAVTVDVPEEDWKGMVCTVPQQVLATAGKTLMVGVYGTDGGERMLPTVWCALGRVKPGAVPAGVEAPPPEAPLWARLQKQLRDVAAANPFMVKGLSMLPRDDGSITLELNRRFEEIQEAAQAGRPVFLEVFGAVLPLTRLIAGSRAEFTGPVFTTQGSTYYHFCTVPDAGDVVVLMLPVGSTPAAEAIQEALAQAKASGEFDGATGPKGDKGDKGADGAKGDPGYTPQLGVDYWTEAHREEIVEEALAVLGLIGEPLGYVDSATKEVKITAGLSDGVYAVKYEDAKGNVMEIGTLQIGEGPVNRIPLSINADGSAYVGDNGEAGYKTRTRLSSTGAESTSTSTEFSLSGFIPVKINDVIRIANMIFRVGNNDDTYAAICGYDSNFAFLVRANCTDKNFENALSTFETNAENGQLVSATIDAAKKSAWSAVKYIRVCWRTIPGAEPILTINQPIE